MSIRQSAKSYLDKHLGSRFERIKVKTTSSYLLNALGFGSIGSSQSFVIQAGIKLEEFWNQVVNDSNRVVNLIFEDNLIFTNELTKTGRLKKRQIDGLFQIEDKIFYREFKCNLDFDSEKKPASEAKIEQVQMLISARYNKSVDAGYVIPCVVHITSEMQKKVSDNISVNGIGWLIDKLETKNLFTAEEFMEYLSTELSVIFRSKMQY